MTTTTNNDTRYTVDYTKGLADHLRVPAYEDQWLVDMLAEHQVLTTEQITQLGYRPTVAHTRRRLRTQAGQRLVTPFTLDPPGRPPIRCWGLGTTGAILAAYRHGGPVPRPATAQAHLHQLATHPNTINVVAANGIFADLAAHVRAHAGVDLRLWWAPRTCRPITAGHLRSARYGGYFHQGRWIGFWFEYHPDPMPPTRLGEHLRRYQQLGRATGVSTLLWWTADPAREQQLLRRLRGQPVDGLTVAVSGPQHGNPADAIWQTAGGGDPVAMADLPTNQRLHHPHTDIRPDDPFDPPPVIPPPPHPIWNPDRHGDEAIIDQWTDPEPIDPALCAEFD